MTCGGAAEARLVAKFWEATAGGRGDTGCPWLIYQRVNENGSSAGSVAGLDVTGRGCESDWD